ncbi:MAG: thioredoxin [Chloroflexi bacterium]|nr:MAG: thioredoxin [Chloroflexota bacterium]
MNERIVIVVALIGLALFFRWYIGWRSRRATQQNLQLAHFPLGQAGIIALYTDHCVQCERLQKPALARLQQRRNDIPVVWRSIQEEAELVKQLGIMTVPTTLVRNAQGQIINVNMGYVDEDVLMQQLSAVSAPTTSVRNVNRQMSNEDALMHQLSIISAPPHCL